MFGITALNSTVTPTPSMGRPRLYATPEERREAHRRSSQKFYNKYVIFLLWWSLEEVQRHFVSVSNHGALCKKRRRQYHKKVKEKKYIPIAEREPSSGKLNNELRCVFCLSVNKAHTRLSSAAWSQRLSSTNAGCISLMLPKVHTLDMSMRSSGHASEPLMMRSTYWRKQNTCGSSLFPKSVTHWPRSFKTMVAARSIGWPMWQPTTTGTF